MSWGGQQPPGGYGGGYGQPQYGQPPQGMYRGPSPQQQAPAYGTPPGGQSYGTAPAYGAPGQHPPSGQNPPPGQHFPPGQNPPPGQHFPPGQQSPPGQNPSSGQRFPPGQNPPPGQHFPPGQNPPPGQHFPSGQNPPPGQHFPPGQNPSAGQHFPPGQQSSPGQQPPPGYGQNTNAGYGGQQGYGGGQYGAPPAYGTPSAPPGPQGGGYGGNFSPPPPQGVSPEIWTWFQAVDADRSSKITAIELQQALMNGNWSPFNPETCRLMIGMFDKDRNGTIDVYEFAALWKYIQDWKACFDRFDTDRSGNIDANELGNAFRQFGYQLSPQFSQTVVRVFDRTKGKYCINFDDFIQACVMLKSLTDKFRVKDSDQNGMIQISYEEFLEMVLDTALKK